MLLYFAVALVTFEVWIVFPVMFCFLTYFHFILSILPVRIIKLFRVPINWTEIQYSMINIHWSTGHSCDENAQSPDVRRRFPASGTCGWINKTWRLQVYIDRKPTNYWTTNKGKEWLQLYPLHYISTQSEWEVNLGSEKSIFLSDGYIAFIYYCFRQFECYYIRASILSFRKFKAITLARNRMS